MKTIIEKIEKLRTTDKPINVPYTDGKNKGINECLKILKKHNIITAPKSIKLSKIVKKLKREFKGHTFHYTTTFFTRLPAISIWDEDTIYCYASIVIKDNELVLEDRDNFDYPKWLYALWIAGTIVEDDLKEVE